MRYRLCISASKEFSPSTPGVGLSLHLIPILTHSTSTISLSLSILALSSILVLLSILCHLQPSPCNPVVPSSQSSLLSSVLCFSHSRLRFESYVPHLNLRLYLSPFFSCIVLVWALVRWKNSWSNDKSHLSRSRLSRCGGLSITLRSLFLGYFNVGIDLSWKSWSTGDLSMFIVGTFDLDCCYAIF